MVVICLLLRRMSPCLACAPPDVCGDSFKSAVSAAIFGFQSRIIAEFVSECFNLNFGEIQKCDGDRLLPLLDIDCLMKRKNIKLKEEEKKLLAATLDEYDTSLIQSNVLESITPGSEVKVHLPLPSQEVPLDESFLIGDDMSSFKLSEATLKRVLARQSSRLSR
ncbi:hypothetical protein Fot_39973 [Forsythia ovata]|uniref:Uncharacterized protein n=1 Tax=Forsythia ovata TaxID=205694 RepID=A0ABD1S6X0_9LAMI